MATTKKYKTYSKHYCYLESHNSPLVIFEGLYFKIYSLKYNVSHPAFIRVADQRHFST